MASQNTLTDELTPPRRPAIGDVGGGQKVNAVKPPNPTTMPTAEDFNQMGKQIVAARAMSPVCIADVANGGTPSIDSAVFANTLLTPSIFTITDHAAGDTSITWPAGTFPPRTRKPRAEVTVNGNHTCTCTPLTSPPGVRINTRTAGALADLPFSLEIWGE